MHHCLHNIAGHDSIVHPDYAVKAFALYRGDGMCLAGRIRDPKRCVKVVPAGHEVTSRIRGEAPLQIRRCARCQWLVLSCARVECPNLE